MTRRDAAAELFRSLELSLLASELPPGDGGKAPEWIKATPAGKVTTRDGRTYTFDPKALAQRFDADGVDIPVDLDHSTVLKASRGETPTTVGYVSDLDARDDGTYARVNWNPAGFDTVAAGTHRYVSPSMHLDAANNATWLHSIALTSAPALSMPAIAAALGLGAAPASLAAVAVALNLPAAADQAAILAAIGAMVPKPMHDATLAVLSSTQDQLNALTASTRRSDVETTVDKALRELKITPAQREGFIAMCATEAGLENFRHIMASTLPMFRPSGLDGRLPPGADRPATAQAILDAAAVYRSDKAKHGVAISLTDAIAAIAHQPAG